MTTPVMTPAATPATGVSPAPAAPPTPVPPDDLGRWLASQRRREAGAVRLEDALLGDRYAAYFAYRLRYFVLRTLVAGVVHAIRILLLFGAFTREEFLLVVLAGATAAVVTDAWWGALERMRGRIRTLQRGGSIHQVPREVAAWLRLAARLSALGLGLAGMVAAWMTLASPGGMDPADLMVVGIVAGASLELTVRTYHSGVFALRRIYRPLPSLFLVDVAGLGVLLVLWPVIGQWAFPAAEVVSLSVVMIISIHYTTRTYRAMAFPALRPLLRLPVPVPSRRELRAAGAPALAAATVGLEAMVLLTIVAAAGPADDVAGAALVALLAALGPVIRAGFEWARLLYFDLIRLGLPLLADLRRRFDRAILRLALVMGGVTWLIAAVVGVVVLGIRDATLVAVLAPFFVARSVLAAAQMRSFAGAAYRRLTVVGLGGLAAFGVALWLWPGVEARLLALAAVLGISAALLIVLPEPQQGEDRVPPLASWLAALRDHSGPVTVTIARFDERSLARGVTRERRRTEAWRRRQVGRRVGRGARSAGGQATWLSTRELAWWLPGGDLAGPGPHVRPARDLADAGWIARLTGGLLAAPPRATPHPSGRAAAAAIAGDPLGLDLTATDPPADDLVADFRARFGTGIVHDVTTAVPPGLAALGSRDRAAVLRAGLRFARELHASGRDQSPYDVSALVSGGRLRWLFLVPLPVAAGERRAWRRLVRERILREAARG